MQSTRRDVNSLITLFYSADMVSHMARCMEYVGTAHNLPEHTLIYCQSTWTRVR